MITIPKEDAMSFCSGQYLADELPAGLSKSEQDDFIIENLVEPYEFDPPDMILRNIEMDVEALERFLSRYGIRVE